ncbi:MAG: glycosyltransferase family 2 protein [Candidatus Levybacteria bacterium]|nr:glycosyltransferase family 2 protein [Candidatus Levybacteria bacterium]
MITAVVLTHNEEKNIVDCLESVKWCDQILVIDDDSQDKTAELSEKEKAEVIRESLGGNFSKQRNIGLERARNEWVLFVDADERITDSLRYEIQSTVADPMNFYSGFLIKRRDVMWGKQLRHGEAGSASFLRLAKRGAGKWEGLVHEKWKIKGRVGKLRNSIQHFPHSTIAQFLAEINLYTDIRSRELYKKGVGANFLSIALHTKVKFLQNYLVKRGFLDGIPGIMSATLMSFHAFLVRGKLWLLWQKD